MIAFLAVAPTGLIIRGPSIRPRTGKPVSATIFDPADNRVSKVDYFNGPGANPNSGLKKISAERSITFLLDTLPQVPLPQKREVPPPPPLPPPNSSWARSPFKRPRSPCALRSRLSPWTCTVRA